MLHKTTTLLLLALILAACSDSTPPEREANDGTTTSASEQSSDAASSESMSSDASTEAAEPDSTTDTTPTTSEDPFATLVALGVVRGHLRAARALYREGETDAAAVQFEQAERALDDETLAGRRSAFEAAFDRLGERIDERVGADEVVETWRSVDESIESVEREIAASPARELEVVAALLDRIHDRYGTAIVNGVVENEADYHASWGLKHVALERIGQIVATSDVERGATAEAGVAISSLEDLWPSLTPVTEVSGDAGRIQAAAERIRGVADEIG
jgi:uncharacterized lipoprotein